MGMDTFWDPPVAADDDDLDLSDMPYADDEGVIHHPGNTPGEPSDEDEEQEVGVPRERVFPRTIEPEPGEYVDGDGFAPRRMGQDDVDLSDEDEVM